MTRFVRFSEPASHELAEAVHWYETRRVGLGAEFFDAIVATVTLIETSPEIGPSISTDGHTRCTRPNARGGWAMLAADMAMRLRKTHGSWVVDCTCQLDSGRAPA